MFETAARLLEGIRALPQPERLRRIELARKPEADEVQNGPASIIGSVASEAGLLKEIVDSAMLQRRQLPLRRSATLERWLDQAITAASSDDALR